MDNDTLAHTKWNCKYHIVFAPKFRRQIIYGRLKTEIGKILRTLCERKEIEIIEANLCVDHIHMLIAIPPKYSVSQIMGYLKAKGQKLAYDIRPLCTYEIQIWQQTFLVQRILRRHSRAQPEENSGVYQEPAERGLSSRPDEFV